MVRDGAGPAERDADRGRDHAVDAGESAVADDEAVLERRPRRGHDVEVAHGVGGADDERRVGGDRRADDRGDGERGRGSLGGRVASDHPVALQVPHR